jgi:phosphoribosylaminoimidazole-succinocarboxamide synthase
VRDVYGIGDHLLMITSDRISAFDVVLPRLIPFKGQVLNQIASYFLQKTAGEATWGAQASRHGSKAYRVMSARQN